MYNTPNSRLNPAPPVATMGIPDSFAAWVEAVAEQKAAEAVARFMQQSRPAAEERVCNQKEACEVLGGVSVQSLYNWADAGIITPYKLGGRTMYKHSELLAALKGRTKPDGNRLYARSKPVKK